MHWLGLLSKWLDLLALEETCDLCGEQGREVRSGWQCCVPGHPEEMTGESETNRDESTRGICLL